MAEEEKKVSINMMSEILNKEGIEITPKTLKQICANEQIPESAYHVYDKGTMVETWLFYPSKVVKTMKDFKKKQARKE
jgi:hypothetical protein